MTVEATDYSCQNFKTMLRLMKNKLLRPLIVNVNGKAVSRDEKTGSPERHPAICNRAVVRLS